MSLFRPTTLKWRLVIRLAVMQGIVLGGLLGLNAIVMSVLWINGDLGNGYGHRVVDAVAQAAARTPDGRLFVRQTENLAELRRTVDGLWFVAIDRNGRRIGEGKMPADVAPVLSILNRIDDATLGRQVGGEVVPIGLVQRVDTDAGRIQVMADVRGPVSLSEVFMVLRSTFGIILFVIGIMVVATLIVTPFVVRRALAGLSGVARQAARIDIRRSGVRLSIADVPAEVVPLVAAMNDALERIDRDYERHTRFLADAAHELRTPIAILTTRIEGLPRSPDRTRLIEDTTRLTVLAGQLLDLQRLDRPMVDFAPVDLVALAQRVLLELAPLAFEAGYGVHFDAAADTMLVDGDEGAIERAVTNLVQNAIDHGGRRGRITVRVTEAPAVEVCDDGNGIATEDREGVFEPFSRLVQGGRGAGLGLDLVRRTMLRHGGFAEVASREERGACLRLVFPARPE